MTKSKFMRVAAVLMAAVLLTTCAISGTFAKYVTTGAGTTQTAQVAKWGVKIQAASTDSAFATSYAKTDSTYSGTDTVVAASTYNVVAPGTSGSGATTISISGTPEVASRVAITATVTLTNWTTNGTDFYCPLVFTVGATEIDGNDYTSAADLQAALATALSSTQDFAPNAPITAGSAGALSWAWDFDDNGAGTNDAKDTALGNRAAEGTNIPTITIEQSATVTQID